MYLGLPHHSQRVLVGYGIFVIDMVFMGCDCKVKNSQLTQKLLNLSRKSYRMLWSARELTLVNEQIYNFDATGLYYNMLPTKA